ncbi:uncharacterized protein LOC124534854 [Vanessa cardui]|uniref:uncharacterized protein LOC124534854 n=1 Tax=Vanessa cardui TaxID=171605 RepID=UPI001F12EEE9|nr:uncharacterized protein LOC124534854 [Vanessa cardui]
MELMSSLLLCALATLVPQALGKKNIMSSGLNETVILKRTPSIDKDHVTSVQVPSPKNKVSELKSVFLEATCKRCHKCMERAIKSHKVNNQIDLIKNEQFNNELVDQEVNTRNKRKTNANALRKVDKKTKKNKSKNKSVTIIKYNDNERIFALKIIETNKNMLLDRQTNNTTTCQVYSVKKSFPCETPEADLILKESKTKINKNKKSKREQNKKNASDVKTTVIAPVFRKRQIDDSQAPEQIMPSVEEIY